MVSSGPRARDLTRNITFELPNGMRSAFTRAFVTENLFDQIEFLAGSDLVAARRNRVAAGQGILDTFGGEIAEPIWHTPLT